MTLHSPIWRSIQRSLLWVGAAALAYVAVTAVYAQIYQGYQSRRFEAELAVPRDMSRSILEPPPDLHEGDLLGRIDIDQIGLSVMVLQGIEERTLIAGAGHVPGTSLPGSEGNVVIAAHRDTFFRKLEKIAPGDRIRVATLRGRYEYIVDSVETVDPTDTQVMESRDYRELTLITCFPFYFVGAAPRRFIVHARPVNSGEDAGSGESPALSSIDEP
ncbi:MAG TPA: class D sortase [Terriglobia bacterium]|nr:class D sortase [Terriglobia bacterium]